THPMRDEVVRYQRAGLHQVHGPPDQLGRVVERAEQRELLVMRPPGIQADRGSGCTATEEYHAAAPARDVDRLLPHLGTARRVDRDVGARAAGGGADQSHDVVGLRRVEALADSEPPYPREPPAGLPDHDDAVALADATDASADRRDRARELVAEHRGNLRDHDRVAATKRLDVRTAGERRVDPEHQLAGFRPGHGQFFRTQVARPVEYHRPHGVTYTLSASRRRIKSTPRCSPGSVTRWVTSRSTDTSPATISRKASARSEGDDEYVAVRVSSRW